MDKKREKIIQWKKTQTWIERKKRKGERERGRKRGKE